MKFEDGAVYPIDAFIHDGRIQWGPFVSGFPRSDHILMQEIDEIIRMVAHSIALDFQIDHALANLNDAEDTVSRLKHEQREIEKHIRIYGRWSDD